jgi:hypothetical protein
MPRSRRESANAGGIFATRGDPNYAASREREIEKSDNTSLATRGMVANLLGHLGPDRKASQRKALKRRHYQGGQVATVSRALRTIEEITGQYGTIDNAIRRTPNPPDGLSLSRGLSL